MEALALCVVVYILIGMVIAGLTFDIATSLTGGPQLRRMMLYAIVLWPLLLVAAVYSMVRR